MQRGVAAGAATGMFLGALGMRRRIGAEEELVIARRGCRYQRLAMGLALQDRQAVVVRTDAALEDLVAVEQQVVRRDGGGRRPFAAST
jgi:hypothetical protein